MKRTAGPRPVLIAKVVLIIVPLAAVGCYNAKELEAFMNKPREPVCGVDYQVLPPDVVQVNSRIIPEINDVRQQVRPDGKINLPLVGELQVAGKTPNQVEREIAELSREYYDYDEIDVTVQVIGFNSQKFYVFGQVHRPGPIPWTGHDTLLDALAQAQIDFTAWPERITVVRGSTPQVGGQAIHSASVKYLVEGVHHQREDNAAKKITINLWAMVKSGDMTNNILLQPNDVIYVRPNPCAKVGLVIQTLLLPVRPAVDSVRAPASAVGALGG